MPSARSLLPPAHYLQRKGAAAHLHLEQVAFHKAQIKSHGSSYSTGFSNWAEEICESDELRVTLRFKVMHKGTTLDSALHQNTEPQLCLQFGILMDKEFSALWDFTTWFER